MRHTKPKSEPPVPFFDSRNGGGADGRRILLITYHFPPDPSVGGLRWERLVKYAAEHEWQVDVIMRDPNGLSIRDDRRLDSMAVGVRIFGVPDKRSRAIRLPGSVARVFRRGLAENAAVRRLAPAPGGSVRREEFASRPLQARLLSAYRAFVDYWDMRAWSRAVVRSCESLPSANDQSYNVVVTSGPPHMAHEAGRVLSRRWHVPHVADFRDPWSLVERLGAEHASSIWFSIAEHLEHRIVDDAALVVMNTEPAAEAMRKRYPAAAERVITIWNGSDNEPLPSCNPDSRFTIRFAGEIYLDRDPRMVFRAAGQIVREMRLSPREFGIQFIGNVATYDDIPIEEIARHEGLEGFLDLGPFRPRAQALEFLAGGTMLLSLPQDSHLAVPAKIFEYTRFDAWLLILARTGSATEQLLRSSGADVVDPADLNAITRVIRERYTQFRRGERPTAVGRTGRFDRRPQAERLLRHIEDILDSRVNDG